MVQDLFAFLRAIVFNHTVPFLAGTGGLILTLIAYTFKRTRPYAAKLFWGLLIVTAFSGSFLEWRQVSHKEMDATRDLNARMNDVHTQDPAYHNLTGVIDAFTAMRKQQPSGNCIILITDPGGANTSVHETLHLGASLAGCVSGGFNGIGPSEGPEAREAAVKDYSPTHVVIHSNKDDKSAFVLFDKLSTLTFVQQSWSSLPWVPPGIVWIQVGRDVQWYRHN